MTDLRSLRIGVLALQGDYERHAAALEEAGVEAPLVKTAEELHPNSQTGGEPLDGLIFPGGESTTMLKFLDRNGLFEAVQGFAREKPVFGTCAGAILLARQVSHPAQRSLGILDMTVERNAYGDQRNSAIVALDTSLPGGPLESVFIRAPRIASVGAEVEVLAERDGYPVLVRQGKTMAATFHPELSQDRRVHRYFIDLVKSAQKTA